MVLDQVFLEEAIIVELESSEKDELFEEMVEAAHSVHPELDRAEAVFALNERESKMTTGIMHSVAIPHAQVKSVKGLLVLLSFKNTLLTKGFPSLWFFLR